MTVGAELRGNQRDLRLRVSRTVVLLYVFAIAGAEAVASTIGPVAGAACHAMVLVAILNDYAFAPESPGSSVFPCLALAPLLRLLSLTMPSRHVAEVWWYAMVGAPLLLGAFLAARAVPVTWPGLRLRKRGVPVQIAIALTGAPLGLAAYEILSPAPLVSPAAFPTFFGACVILILFSALPEEVIFRGLLQGSVRELFGVVGLVIVSGLYAALYVGSMSAEYVAFAGGVALVFAIAVDRTGMLWGAVAARALVNIGLLLVWPTLYG
jgi:membrane protease YdiL (CAAX protease family)